MGSIVLEHSINRVLAGDLSSPRLATLQLLAGAFPRVYREFQLAHPVIARRASVCHGQRCPSRRVLALEREGLLCSAGPGRYSASGWLLSAFQDSPTSRRIAAYGARDAFDFDGVVRLFPDDPGERYNCLVDLGVLSSGTFDQIVAAFPECAGLRKTALVDSGVLSHESEVRVRAAFSDSAAQCALALETAIYCARHTPPTHARSSSQSLSAPKHGAPSTQQDDSSMTASGSRHEPDAHSRPGAHQDTPQHSPPTVPHGKTLESWTPAASHTPAELQVAGPSHHIVEALKMQVSYVGRSVHEQHGCGGSPQSVTHAQLCAPVAPRTARAATIADSTNAILQGVVRKKCQRLLSKCSARC